MKKILLTSLILLTIFVTFESALAWHRPPRGHFKVIIPPPPLFLVPPVIYYRGYFPPPNSYRSPDYYDDESYRVWVPGHWEERWGPYGWERVWIPGHWRYYP